LRATSSVLASAPNVPFRKLLKIQKHTDGDIVGIALAREQFTSAVTACRFRGQMAVEKMRQKSFLLKVSEPKLNALVLHRHDST
jgi:hypothetical protein